MKIFSISTVVTSMFAVSGAMADYTSPKPVDPIWYQTNAFLRIDCRCRRSVTYPLGDFARVHRLPSSMALYELIDRLRCENCGERPSSAKVTRHP